MNQFFVIVETDFSCRELIFASCKLQALFFFMFALHATGNFHLVPVFKKKLDLSDSGI